MRGLVEARDWEKVAREAAVFVEDKLRNWASISPSVTGSVNVFKAAIGSSGFLLPKAGPTSEQQGWQQLAIGFALALRNPSGHQVKNRSDAERYALGGWAWLACCSPSSGMSTGTPQSRSESRRLSN